MVCEPIGASTNGNEEKELRRAFLVFRLFLAFVEFAIQFTLVLGLSFFFLKVLKLPFWSLACLVYVGLFALSFFFLFPKAIEIENAGRVRRGVNVVSPPEKRYYLGQLIKEYLINIVITTIVLSISSSIVGVAVDVGPYNLGAVLERNTNAALGAGFGAFLLNFWVQNFDTKPV